MNTEEKFYLCPVCFRVCETDQECHEHRMIECNVGKAGDERRRPVMDKHGNLVSRAPRWYLEAIGSLRK